MTLATSTFAALGTNVSVVCTHDLALADAVEAARVEIGAIDRACSRFRDDSELVALNRQGGRPFEVSPTLFEALEVALRAAFLTEGRVTPTVGEAIRHLGYDRSFVSMPHDAPVLRLRITAAPSWRTILLEPAIRRVLVPAGIELDLGATAKALAVDRSAIAAALAVGDGVGLLVSIGGDIAVAGPTPDPGWVVQVADDHAQPFDDALPTVAIRTGGLATSGTANRRWRQGGVERHHLIDPGRGEPVEEHWRTVTVAAATCVDANIASTAAMILGPSAPAWLSDRGIAARLSRPTGTVEVVGGWPSDDLTCRRVSSLDAARDARACVR